MVNFRPNARNKSRQVNIAGTNYGPINVPLSARDDFRANRVAALTHTWQALCDVEDRLRRRITGQDDTPHDYRPDVAAINMLLIRYQPFLLADEQYWATTYLNAVIQIDQAVRDPQNTADPEWWDTTLAQPPYLVDFSQALWSSQQAHDQLAYRYALVVRGQHE